MATAGYTYGIRNALQQKGVNNNRIGYNSKTGSVTIDGKDFIKPGTVSNGVANTTQYGFKQAWNSFSNPAQNATLTAAQNAAKAAQQAAAKQATPAPVAAPTTAYSPVTPQQSTLDAIQKAVQNQSQYQFKGPDQPFTYDQTTDPAYQAQLAEAKRQVAIQQLDTNAMLRGNGQGKSSYSESVAAQSANNALAGIANNLVPQLMQAAYQRYNDTANRDLQIQQANYNVGQDTVSNLGNQYTYQNQEYFQNPIAEASITGNYLPQGAKQAIQDLLNLKGQAEAKGVTKDQRTDYSKQADQIRTYLKSIGIDPTQYGSNVTQKSAAARQNEGIRTLQGQQLDLQNRQANLNAAIDVGTLTGKVVNPQSDWTGLFRQAANPNAPLNYTAQQAAITNAQENRRLGQTDRSLTETERANKAGEQYNNDRLAFDKDTWTQEFANAKYEFGEELAIKKMAQILDRDQLEEVIRSNLANEGMDQQQIDQRWAEIDAGLSGSGGAAGGFTQQQVLGAVQNTFQVPVLDSSGQPTVDSNDVPIMRAPNANDYKNNPDLKRNVYDSVLDYELSEQESRQVLYALGLTKQDVDAFFSADQSAGNATGTGGGGSGSKPNTAMQASFKPGSGGLTFTNGTSGYNNYYQAQKFVGKKNFNSNGAAIAQALQDGGYPSSWLAPTLELVARESAFSHTAKNPKSTARGLFQFLDGTRKNYGGSKVDWNDPYQQSVKGLQYIKDRYGDPVKALKFWDKNNYY